MKGSNFRKGTLNAFLQRDVEPEIQRLRHSGIVLRGSSQPTWSYGIFSRVENALMSVSVLAVNASSLSKNNSLEDDEGSFS